MADTSEKTSTKDDKWGEAGKNIPKGSLISFQNVLFGLAVLALSAIYFGSSIVTGRNIWETFIGPYLFPTGGDAGMGAITLCVLSGALWVYEFDQADDNSGNLGWHKYLMISLRAWVEAEVMMLLIGLIVWSLYKEKGGAEL